jgi:hypothetical protein
MQIYKTTNAFYLLFYVAAHTTQTAEDISCVADVHPTTSASLLLRSLVLLFGFVWNIFYVVMLIFLYFHKY